MDSLEEHNSCITLNNTSVMCIVRGEYDTAINILLKVLGLMRKSIAMQQHQNQTFPNNLSDNSTSARVPDFWYEAQQGRPTVTSTNHSSHHDETGYVFQHPILLREYVQNVKISTATVNTIAVMYNLALAFHLKGASSGIAVDHSKRDYDRAISLYKLCYQMLVMNHQCGSQKTITIDFDPCLLMAISNNIGMIYTACGMKEKAKTFFQHLLSTQMYCYVVTMREIALDGEHDEDNASSSGGGGCGGDTLSQLDDFWSNTLELVLASGSAPAA